MTDIIPDAIVCEPPTTLELTGEGGGGAVRTRKSVIVSNNAGRHWGDVTKYRWLH